MNAIIKKISSSSEEYTLKENEKTILKVRYRRDMNTARVETIDEQRILLIKNEGLLKIRMAIKNEYGVEIGQMFYDNWSDNNGVVQIDRTRYRFTLNTVSSQELYIYKGNYRNLIYKCNLAFEIKNQSNLKEWAGAFIISIVWHLHQLSVQKERSELVS